MNEIYKEMIPFPLVRWVIGVLAAFVFLFLSLLFYQLLIGPIGTRPAPNWVYLLMALWLSGVIALLVNFLRLTTKITPQGIRVSFGIFKRVITWENVKGCYIDEASAVRYGGWGVRIGRVKGRWRLVYNVIRCPRIVVELKEGRFKEFVFSTKNPEEIMEIIRRHRGG
jgi:hypothetical protein